MTEFEEIYQQAMAAMAALPSPPTAEERAEAERAREAENARIVAHRIERAVCSCLPPIVAEVVNGPLTDTPGVVAVREWLASPARGLVIRGGVGVGKTVAAGALARMCIAQGRAVSWHRPNEFVSAVLHSYDERSPKLAKGVVIIDDVGRETKADFEESVCTFIDDRDTRFVITTNLTRDDFRARYDARLIDRLNHCARAVALKGASRRRQDGGF